LAYNVEKFSDQKGIEVKEIGKKAQSHSVRQGKAMFNAMDQVRNVIGLVFGFKYHDAEMFLSKKGTSITALERACESAIQPILWSRPKQTIFVPRQTFRKKPFRSPAHPHRVTNKKEIRKHEDTAIGKSRAVHRPVNHLPFIQEWAPFSPP
jgi:hypothetical protein